MGMERGTVSNLLAELKSQGIQGHLPGITGYSEAEKFNAEKIKEKALSWGDKTCDWCGCWCHCIHSHHYPLPLRMGGSDLVGICGKCHADFHFIERTTKGGQSL